MIFLNYRKADTQPTVDHLAERLKAAFGPENVFKDDSDLQGGDRWPARLRDELARRKLLLAVIGPGWLKAADDFGRRRLDDADDWVRAEICTALRTGKTVVTLLADGMTPLPAAGLPRDCELQQLPDIQQVELRKGEGRAADLRKLVELLAGLTKLTVRTDPPPLPPSPRPPPAPPRVPGLPAAPPVCVGRNDLLATLSALFLPKSAKTPLPALAVAGIGGIGKSTAVLWFLHDPRVAERYGDRRHFVPLDGATDRSTVVGKLAEYLGVPLGPDLEPRVLAALRGGKPRLLVLDNAETPLATDRLKVEELLTVLGGVAHVGVVATLRPGVPLPNFDRPFEVESLKPPYDLATFHDYCGNAFRADPDAAGFVATLAGWPLVLKLAASRAKHYDRVREFRTVWDRKKAKFQAEGKDHTNNLDISVALSLDALRKKGPLGERLLAVLARLPEGLLKADLETVLGEDGVEAAAEVQAVGGLMLADADRLWLLAPMREHLLPLSPLADADRDRLVRHFCAVAEEGEKLGTADAATAIARLAPRVAACVDVIELGLALPKPVVAYRAARGLGEYGRFIGLDFSPALDRAAMTAGERGDTLDHARCLLYLGYIALARWDHAGAVERYEAALALYRRVGDVLGEANSVRSLGDIALARSDHAGAAERYEAALALYRRVRSVLGEANSVRSLGDIALAQSDHAGAAERYEAALPLYRRVGDVLGEANCVKSLGDIALARSDHAGAAERYKAAPALYRRVGSVLGEANCVTGLGDIAKAENDPTTARRKYDEALALYQRIEDLYSIGWTYRRLARLTTDAAKRAGFAAARTAWLSIDRPDLVAELDAEYPPTPPTD